MKEFNINDVIEKLKKKGKVFVSEKDFQLELAWTIKELYKNDVSVKLEYRPKDVIIEYTDKNKRKRTTSMYIDILVIQNNKWYPIELKYKTNKIINNIEHIDYYIDSNDKDEIIELKNQSARDQGRCNFLWDISRIEQLKKQKVEEFAKGYAILITNDSNYFEGKQKNKTSADEDFKIDQERKIIKRTLEWKKGTKPGTIGSCPRRIELENIPNICWKEYIDLNKVKEANKYKNGKFKYVCVEI